MYNLKYLGKKTGRDKWKLLIFNFVTMYRSFFFIIFIIDLEKNNTVIDFIILYYYSTLCILD